VEILVNEFESTIKPVTYTYKCRDSSHIRCQALKPSFVMDLSLFAIKSPESIGTIIEILALAVSL